MLQPYSTTAMLYVTAVSDTSHDVRRGDFDYGVEAEQVGHHKSGGRVNHGFRVSFHGCVTIRDVISILM